MKNSKTALAGAVLAFVTFALASSAAPAAQEGPAVSQEKACLQSNRMWGFNVVNERTLQVTDRTYKRYTVHMTSGCVGLNNAVLDVRLLSKTALGCLSQGDRVSFQNPDGLGRLSCIVTGVENYVPPPPKQGD